jgi:hypothetical protein
MIVIIQRYSKSCDYSLKIFHILIKILINASLLCFGFPEKIVGDLMRSALPLDVPVEVEMNTGDNWLAAH